jgi:hypothetical protein
MKRSRCVAPVAALISSCQGCEEIRMKPVKAWAVVRNQRLHGQASDNLDVILVMSNKPTARKYCMRNDRIARVEIREVN